MPDPAIRALFRRRRSPQAPAVQSWTNRVVANGGAAPSTYTQQQILEFLGVLQAAGIYPLIKAMCICVPDSLIAAITPIINLIGNDPWTNTNFVAGDLDPMGGGLKGNGTNKVLNSGVNPSTAFSTSNSGATIFTTSTSNLAQNELGCATAAAGVPSFLLAVSNGSNAFADAFDQSTTRLNTANGFWYGYLSANRTSTTAFNLYKANPATAHATLATSGATNVSTGPNLSTFVHAWNLNGTAASYSSKRVFAVAFHDGLTSAQSAAFYNALNNLQIALTPSISSNPLVTAWANQVVTNGGAAPSGATTLALTKFANTLDGLSLTAKMIALNCFVADSLIACQTPLIHNAGNVLWTNNNFVLADLTVNGLKGNGSTKFLDTGVLGSATGLSVSNGGMTIYTQTASAGGENDMGCNNSNAPSFALIVDFSGNSYNDAYDQSTTRIGPVANGGFKGYHSNNRITTTDFKVYQASGSVAHNTFGTNAGTNASLPTNLSTFSVYVFCWNATGTANSFSTKRVAFAAIHQGLTSAESASFYEAIQQLRIDLGGGYV